MRSSELRGGASALTFVLALAACHREETTTTDAAPPAPASATSAPLSIDASAAAGATDAARPGGYADRVRSWNEALDSRDPSALAAMYAANVRFYGKKTPRAAVVAAKASYFAKHPDFRQTLGPVTMNGARATFSKTVTVGGKTQSFAAYLVFDAASGGSISVEGDETTDKNRHANPCEDALAEIVAKKQEAAIASCLHDVSVAKGDDVGCGGMTLPPDEGGSVWTFEVFENHPDHMIARAFLEVDLAKRTAKDTEDTSGGDDGTPFPFDAKLMDAAVNACAGVAPPPP